MRKPVYRTLPRYVNGKRVIVDVSEMMGVGELEGELEEIERSRCYALEWGAPEHQNWVDTPAYDFLLHQASELILRVRQLCELLALVNEKARQRDEIADRLAEVLQQRGCSDETTKKPAAS